MIIGMHLTLAILMFFGINFLGHHTPVTLRYYQLTTFLETDEAPAFNYLIRVLTPIVILILISSLFYYLEWDSLVRNIYLVNIYYVSFRFAFNLSINRRRLINWKRQFVYAFSIIIISYFLYEKLIKIKANLLPDFNNIANELWIIILVFIYHVINNLQYSDDKTMERKNDYLKNRYLKFKNRYGFLINKKLQHAELELYLYAIMIYEDFNRPKLFRLIEYIKFFFLRKPLTLGIMQVSSDKFIGDKESILAAIKILDTRYEELQLEFNSIDTSVDENEWQREYRQSAFLEKLLVIYNIRSDYANEIKMIVDAIIAQDTITPSDLFTVNLRKGT